MDANEHIEWVYREACVRLHNESRAAGKPVKGNWFQLVCLLDDLFPKEIAEYRKRMGIDP